MENGPASGSLLPPGLSYVQLLDLYGALSRGVAAEEVIRQARQGQDGADSRSFPPLAVLGATFPLRRGAVGSGDLLGLAMESATAAIVHGAPPEALFARLHPTSGRPPGRNGPLDWTDLPGGLLGPNAPPGVLLGVMAGITLAFRLKGEDRAGLFLGGVAESASGAWHEAINFAAVQRCPLVLVVLNEPAVTHPSVGRIPRGASAPAGRGVPYGIYTTRLDDHDLPGILAAVNGALERARGGGGVTLVEVTTDPAPSGRQPESDLHRLRVELQALGPEMPQRLEVIDAASRVEMQAAWLGVGRSAPRPPGIHRSPFHRPVPRISAPVNP